MQRRRATVVAVIAVLAGFLLSAVAMVSSPRPSSAATSMVLQYSVSAGDTITLPLRGYTGLSVTWGDGSSPNPEPFPDNGSYPSHRYVNAGSVTITVSATTATWLWVLTRKGEAVAIANLATGELIDKAGHEWGRWSHPRITDEQGSPAVAIAYQLEVQQRGSSHSSTQVVHPSLARGMFKIATEDGDTATVTPLTQLTSLDDVREAWRGNVRPGMPDPGYEPNL